MEQYHGQSSNAHISKIMREHTGREEGLDDFFASGVFTIVATTSLLEAVLGEPLIGVAQPLVS